jgi:hypothetical protein
MRSAKSLLLFFLVSALPAFATTWPKEPAHFEGLKFGEATEADLKARLKVTDCRYTENIWNMPLRWCESSVSVGELSIRTVFVFHEGRLRLVGLRDLPTERFEYIRDAFIARYGQPTATEKTPAKTKSGREYVNEEVKWRGKAVQIRVSRHSNRVSEMSVHIGLNEFVDHIEATSKKE